MSLRDVREEGMPCGHCGQFNGLRAAFCDGCGMELRRTARPSGPPEEKHDRRVLLSRSLPTEELDRLWNVFEAAQGTPWFPERIVWPEDDDGGLLQQELPPGTLLLPEARELFEALKPARKWLALVCRIANAVEEVQRAGCRLNSFSFNSIILARDTHEFVGFCLPICLTLLDAPRSEMSLGGLDCCFAAPEIQGFVEHPAGKAADVYNLAALAYYLISGDRPRDLMECGFSPAREGLNLGPSLKECLEDALSLTPERRPSSAGMFVERLRKALIKDACRDGRQLQSASLTDLGIGGRENNEDACGVWTQTVMDAHGRGLVSVVAVADGMGGGAFGERASSLCVDRLVDDAAGHLKILGDSLAFPNDWPEACRNWLQRLNREMLELGSQLAAKNDVGSTLTAVLFLGRRAFLLHAGDSLLYLVRAGGVSQLTCSQSYAEQLHREGWLTQEEVESSIYRNALTSYIGSPKCAPQVEELHLASEDILVLCSDGLMEGLTKQDVLELAVRFAPREAVVEMIRRGKKRLQDLPSDPGVREGIACSDNMTAVVLRIQDDPAAAPDASSATPEASYSPLTSQTTLGEPDA